MRQAGRQADKQADKQADRYKDAANHYTWLLSESLGKSRKTKYSVARLPFSQ